MKVRLPLAAALVSSGAAGFQVHRSASSLGASPANSDFTVRDLTYLIVFHWLGNGWSIAGTFFAVPAPHAHGCKRFRAVCPARGFRPGIFWTTTVFLFALLSLHFHRIKQKIFHRDRLPNKGEMVKPQSLLKILFLDSENSCTSIQAPILRHSALTNHDNGNPQHGFRALYSLFACVFTPRSRAALQGFLLLQPALLLERQESPPSCSRQLTAQSCRQAGHYLLCDRKSALKYSGGSAMWVCSHPRTIGAGYRPVQRSLLCSVLPPASE